MKVDPALAALAKLRKMLDDHAHDSQLHPKTDLYGHGTQVGEYIGILRAIAVIQDAMSASEEADAKL